MGVSSSTEWEFAGTERFEIKRRIGAGCVFRSTWAANPATPGQPFRTTWAEDRSEATARISFPEAGIRDGNNAQPADKLTEILRAMREDHAQHYATGTVRFPSSLSKAWEKCVKKVGIEERFTVHGLRRSFNDLARHAGLDPIVTKSLTGHVTESMREQYSTVNMEEKRRAVGSVVGLLPGLTVGASKDESGDAGGDGTSKGNHR